jgi:hypothetical protein
MKLEKGRTVGIDKFTSYEARIWETHDNYCTKLENGRPVGIVTFTSYKARKWETCENYHVNFVEAQKWEGLGIVMFTLYEA